MDHPIEVESAIAAFWLADDVLKLTPLRFGKAAEGDSLPYAVMSTVLTTGRRGRAPERSTDSEYVRLRLALKVYGVGEYESGTLSRNLLARLRETSIAGIEQLRVIDDGHPIEDEERVWFWISALEVQFIRSRVAVD